jgi:guanine deaminase
MKILANIFNPLSKEKTELLDQHILEIDTQTHNIVNIRPKSKNDSLNSLDLNLNQGIIIPTLIDAHTHLPQYPIIGKYGESLLGWLKKYTFPIEKKFANIEYAKNLSAIFFNKLKSEGTGTAVIYTTIHADSTDIAFQEAEKSNLRIIMGKVMMDQKSPVELTESPVTSLKESSSLSQKWHRKTQKLY